MGLVGGGLGGFGRSPCTAPLLNLDWQADFPQEEVWGGISQLHGNKELPGGPPSPPRGFVAPKFRRGM